MRNFVLAAAIALAACGHQPPEVLEAVHSRVNAAHKYQDYAKRDFRPMAAGEGGNCARFAATYQQGLGVIGIQSRIGMCVLAGGVAHAFTVTNDGWVLDNRFRWVTSIKDVGCITEPIYVNNKGY